MSLLRNIAADFPPFTDNPVDRLRHTLAAYHDTDGSKPAITATQNLISGHDWTGLTFGDLRALLAEVESGGAASKLRSLRDSLNRRGYAADVAVFEVLDMLGEDE